MMITCLWRHRQPKRCVATALDSGQQGKPLQPSRRVRRDDMDVIRPHVTGLLDGAMRPIPRLCWSEQDQQ
jgi:hypothetical protein